MKKLLLVLMIFSLSGFVIAEQFVVPKKKRVSTASIKESIGQRLGETIKKSADIIAYQAQMQKECIKKTKELLEQDQSSFFAKTTAQKLQECDAAIANLIDVMEDCQKKIHQAFSTVVSSAK